MFSKSSVSSYLVLFLAVMAFAACPKSITVRGDGPGREAALRFEPVRFAASGFAPLRLVGAWRVQVDDPRFGGVSGLAMDGGALLALTDSGSIIRLPPPGGGARALIRDLPTGPGLSQSKFNRDSEALARDPKGRGWWVTFEHWHQAWLYDRDFRRALSRIDFGRERWPANRGLEALVADADGLLLFPEAGAEWLRLTGNALRSNRLVNSHGDIADAVRLPDGRLLLVTRRFGLDGIAKQLVVAEASNGGLDLRLLARLDLGATDNVEAIAAEPLADGTRLWLMTDNDFRARAPTYLVALDFP